MISPIKLPVAAGVNYSNGDVRHLTDGDVNSNQSIAACTRQLAFRDNLLAAAINLVIAEVNNKEQIINISVPRASLSASESLIVTNFRIPTGFEARVLNAVVSSTSAGDAQLDVLYSTGFGLTTGTSIASTVSEVSGQTLFYGTGELIITLTNIGTSLIEAVGDVHITMRPIVATQAALLVPGVNTGGNGASGFSGASGASGMSGSQGTSGYSGFSGYSGIGDNSYSLTTASFVMPAISSTVTVTMDSTAWIAVGQIIYLESAGYFSVDSIGDSTHATVTNLGYTGNASPGGTIATTKKVSPGGIKGTDGSSSGAPTYTSNHTETMVVVADTTGNGYVAGTSGDGYGGGYVQNSSNNVSVPVLVVRNSASGMLCLQAQLLLTFYGSIFIDLPQTSSTPNAGYVNWHTTSGADNYVTCVATNVNAGSHTTAAVQPLVSASSSTRWKIEVPGTTLMRVNIVLNGVTVSAALP